MTGLPTVTVKLDNGTGTFPTDVTTRVRMKDGVTVAPVGRTDEFNQTQPSTLTLTLDNADGHVTDGTITLVPNTTLIRYTETSGATTVNQFTGRVVTLSLGWPGGGQEFATVMVSASDYLADMGRRGLSSMLEEDIHLDAPSLYYILNEPEGSTQAFDSSGNLGVALSVVGDNPALTFGGGTGPVDGLAALKMNGASTDGQFLSGAAPAFTASGPFSAECFFSTTFVPAFQYFVSVEDSSTFTNDMYVLGIQSSGHISAFVGGTSAVSPATYFDGSTHHAAMTYDGTTLKLYADGALVASTLASPHGLTPGTLSIGSHLALNQHQVFAGTISHVALYSSVLAAGRSASHAQALSGFAETTDARLSRLASYVGLAATTTTASGQIMGAQATSGQSSFDAMQTVALAEGGIVYVDGTGNLQMQGRYYRSQKVTADLAVTSDAVDPGTAVTWDTQQLVNQVTVTRTGGASQVVGTPTGANFSQSIELDVDTDASALSAAQWLLNTHDATTPRLASVTVDLLAPPSGTTAASLIGLGLGSRLSITPMPSQMWAGTTDFTIEGWSRTLTDSTWSVTYNLLPWSLFQVFTLDNATYGVLDSTTPIGY